MKTTQFNFRFRNNLKELVEKYGKSQKPEEDISTIIHKALYKYLDR